MAHFARLDSNNTVTEIIVISNADLVDEHGIEQEEIGIAICETVAGPGPWKQTSYNGNFRKKYACIGDKFDVSADVFYNPNAPFPSWSLDGNFDWQPPIPKPDDGKLYDWDETTLAWIEVVFPEQ